MEYFIKITKTNLKTVNKVIANGVCDPSGHPYGHADLWGLFTVTGRGVFYSLIIDGRVNLQT